MGETYEKRKVSTCTDGIGGKLRCSRAAPAGPLRETPVIPKPCNINKT